MYNQYKYLPLYLYLNTKLKSGTVNNTFLSIDCATLGINVQEVTILP